MAHSIQSRTVRATMGTIFLGLLTLLMPLSAQAYEEDTHFTMTYVQCRLVGFTDREANIVASYDQGMDDSPGTVANIVIFPQITEEILWHALPAAADPNLVLTRKMALYQSAATEPDVNAALKRLGIFFHYQQDTWAHRHHPNSNDALFAPYTAPLGHALDGHQPDRPPFDPVCALRCLEDGIGFARMFLHDRLGRTPNPLFDNYTPARGDVDDAWNDPRKGTFVHELALENRVLTTVGSIPVPDPSFIVHLIVTLLIRQQIDAYTVSSDFNPNFAPGPTADEASYDSVRAELQGVVGPLKGAIVIPTTRTPLTFLTTAQILAGQLQGQDYVVTIHTGNEPGAGTDANIFLTLHGTTGNSGEIRLNPLISGNAFEQNKTDTCNLLGVASIGDLTSITIRSDDAFPFSAWFLDFVEISGPGIATRRFTLNDWIQAGSLTRTLQ
jgi:hypothetical protein